MADAGGIDDGEDEQQPLKQATPVRHGYFSQPSNRHASRLLESPKWREANTATSASFLSGYFARSRLHHLSTWKAQMQDMVGQALRDEGKGRDRGSPILPKGVARIIMHIDFDSFFVTVGLRSRPELRGKPVVVCHSTSVAGSAATGASTSAHQSSTSEIASCSYEARAHGVRNGMSLGQARKYCPQVQPIPYAFQEYHDTSIQLYSLLLAHADAIEAVSVDEALIDVSLLLQQLDSGDDAHPLAAGYAQQRQSHPDDTHATCLAHALRHEIQERTGCSASIGIGSNILLARLATRKAKPGGVWHLKDDAIESYTSALDVDDLHGIGWHTREDLRARYGTILVGELRTLLTEPKLNAALGPKQGTKVWRKLHGQDRDMLEPQKLRQSVGANVNYAIRFASQAEAREFVHKLCEEVVRRLRAARVKGRQLAVNVMVRAPDAPAEAPKFLGHGVCDVHHRSTPIAAPGGGGAVDTLEIIESKAWSLIASLRADPRELRGIGVSLHKLELAEGGGGPAAVQPERGQQLLNFGARSVSSAPSLAPAQAQPAVTASTEPQPETVADGVGQAAADGADLIVKTEPDDVGMVVPLQHSVSSRAVDKGKAPIRGGDPEPPISTTDVDAEATADDGTDPTALESPPKERVPPPSSFVPIPTMSQIDPAMLSELPEWARAEVIRDAELGRKMRLQGKKEEGAKVAGTSSKRALSAVEEEEEELVEEAQDVDRERIVAPAAAALSKICAGDTNAVETTTTPRKKARVGTGTGGADAFETMLRSARTPERHRTPGSGGGNTPRRSGGNAHQQGGAAPDPVTMTDEEVRALEIDPAFLRALPLGIQREVVGEHWAARRGADIARVQARVGPSGATNMSMTGRKDGGAGAGAGVGGGALFKAGQVHRYGSRAEERKEAARKAAVLAVRPSTSTRARGGKGGGARSTSTSTSTSTEQAPDQTKPIPLLVVAQRQNAEAGGPSLTTRQGESIASAAEVRALLSQWFAKRRHQPPRESEVGRIRGFVLECVRSGARIGSAHWDVEGALGALGWWRRLLEEAWAGLGPEREGGQDDDEDDDEEGRVGRAWWAKWRELRDEVATRISERAGHPVRI